MYFQIENTPEHIRRARRNAVTKQPVSPEVTPQLVLAPFSRPPQVVFHNVPIGIPCKRSLEIYNPSKQIQQLKLSKALPPDLVINLPGETLDLEPDDCYSLSLVWTPTKPTALRETIRFTNESRGRFDVVLVLKSVVNTQMNKKKPVKISPGKIQKRTVKKSPKLIKTNVVYDTTTFKKTVTTITNLQQIYHQYEKENVPENMNFSIDSKSDRNPFGSPVNFDSSEIFSNLRKTKTNIDNAFQHTYDKLDDSQITTLNSNHKNVLKQSNKLSDSNSDLFDKISFTPLKCISNKPDLARGPRVVISMNESDNEDEENENFLCKPDDTQSIMSVMSKGTERWLISEQQKTQNDQFLVPRIEPVLDSQIPNTSSPKDNNGPNFSINTDFSRISDVSFLPPRCSTEKKMKININDTHEILDDAKVNCDTFTKDTSFNYSSMNYNVNLHLPTNLTEQKPTFNPGGKVCRQNLFKEFQQNKDNQLDYWPQNLRPELKSPAAFEAPLPLQCILEESTQLSETQVLNKTHTNTFTINRTFDTTSEFTPKIRSTQNTWSKKDVRADHELWKVPTATAKKTKKAKLNSSTSSKVINTTYDGNNSTIRNSSFYQPGNVYSQSLTVDPFLSTTYYYDEEAVKNFETDFKRWLNCILTPPADLDSNIEQKIDVGKAWVENRNKEIPLAPTREKVCSAYHNNHRLESLRRSAKALLFNQEISLVILKLNVQIEKKLIAIRTDRNLHLDVCLQKTIVEIILCYNPLWLRIGLEAIYNTVLPLKSNSDIEGLTAFIIQRMFKNPFLKNKHSKSSAPNMLLPAYVDAIKKFTLKKFFMLVFFLDQAKQKKLIAHDPCLFCRSAPYKESREIIIRFTREVIAGIGDITRHLRPLGYVVKHKQTNLDEFIYAVNNIAIDIRDGVRLTRVMEIILMKNDLLKQLRTPAVSRLQKIHNVQVAMNALKEANFTIVGDITATDIADGHREKTLSLLWQIIHVFRAPLFEKAASVIQVWWKKKYQAILEKRYAKMKTAVVVIQALCRMQIQRKRFLEVKRSVLKIEDWYIRTKKIREAKNILQTLRAEREVLRNKAATKIQSHVRKLIYMTLYRDLIRRTVFIQSLIRCYLQRKKFLALKKAAIIIQTAYRSRNVMKKDMQAFTEMKTSAIKIQTFYRMIQRRRQFMKLKHTVKVIEEKYIALQEMRKTRTEFIKLKQTVIKVQAHYRGNKQRQIYTELKLSTMRIQDWYRRAKLIDKAKQTLEFLKLEKCQLRQRSAVKIQSHVRKWLCMREYRSTINRVILIQSTIRMYMQRKRFLLLLYYTLYVQRLYRGKLFTRKEMNNYQLKRQAAIKIQSQYKMLLQRRWYSKLKQSVLTVEKHYTALINMRREKANYNKTRNNIIKIQSAYRGRRDHKNYITVRTSVLQIQNWYRRTKLMNNAKITLENLKLEREIKRNAAATKIQSHVRKWLCVRQYNADVQKVTLVQSLVRRHFIRKRYLILLYSTVYVQKMYRGKLEMRKEMESYKQKREAIIKIQSYYKMFAQRQQYLRTKKAVLTIEEQYKALVLMRKTKAEYTEIRHKIIKIQAIYRGRKECKTYKKIRLSTMIIQDRFRRIQLIKQAKIKLENLKIEKALLLNRSAVLIQSHIRKWLCVIKYKKTIKKMILIQSLIRAYLVKKQFMELKQKTQFIQNKYRAKLSMIRERAEYQRTRNAIITIQSYYRMLRQRREYEQLKQAVWVMEERYIALMKMRQARNEFITVKNTAILIQAYYRGLILRKYYSQQKEAAIKIQRKLRATILMRNQRTTYLKLKQSADIIQTRFRAYLEMKTQRTHFIVVRKSTVLIQRNIRRYLAIKHFRIQLKNAIEHKRQEKAAVCIQKHYRRFVVQSKYMHLRSQAIKIQQIWRGKLVTRLFRCEFLQKRRSIVLLQAVIRGYLLRKRLQVEKERIQKEKEEIIINVAVVKIQSYFRGYKVRKYIDGKLIEIARRCREKILQSSQQTLRQRYDRLMHLLRNMYEIGNIILIFTELEYLTDIYPMLFHETTSLTVASIFPFMLTTNRSISSVKLLTYASAALVNLTRYSATGPKVYDRDFIEPMLKFMLRFSNSEPKLFCQICTFIWMFAKYDGIRQDLQEYLKQPDNIKLLNATKTNIEKAKKKPFTVAKYSMTSMRNDRAVKTDTKPSLEPLFRGSVKKLAYFSNPHQAVNAIYETFNL